MGWITEDTFVCKSDSTKNARRFTMTNAQGTTVQHWRICTFSYLGMVINYGATITSLQVPDQNSKIDDIVLGFDSLDGYLSDNNPYFGATIGRTANRIANGKMKILGKEYQLSINNGKNHLHGGIRGFDKKYWDAEILKNTVVFSCTSQDGEEGYPGHVLAQVIYELNDDNELAIVMKATTTKSTPVGFTNHSYFNLSGHDKAADKLSGHYIKLNCVNYTPVDEHLIPTGHISRVEGTKFDLRRAQNISKLLKKFPPEGPNGYDHNFEVFSYSASNSTDVRLVGSVQDVGSGRFMTIYTNQPGVQFYTANFFPEESEKRGIQGKQGAQYWKHGAFCLETQHFPDAINHKNFPCPILHPGDTYSHKVVYKFLTAVTEASLLEDGSL